jgi:hypothetical protein
MPAHLEGLSHEATSSATVRSAKSEGEYYLPLPDPRNSDANTLRTSDCEIPNCLGRISKDTARLAHNGLVGGSLRYEPAFLGL